MPFPPYLHGPPVTSHTIADTWYLRYGAGDRLRPALISGFRFRVMFVTSRSMKSSTTAVVPFSPPSRSYNEQWTRRGSGPGGPERRVGTWPGRGRGSTAGTSSIQSGALIALPQPSPQQVHELPHRRRHLLVAVVQGEQAAPHVQLLDADLDEAPHLDSDGRRSRGHEGVPEPRLRRADDRFGRRKLESGHELDAKARERALDRRPCGAAGLPRDEEPAGEVAWSDAPRLADQRRGRDRDDPVLPQLGLEELLVRRPEAADAQVEVVRYCERLDAGRVGDPEVQIDQREVGPEAPQHLREEVDARRRAGPDAQPAGIPFRHGSDGLAGAGDGGQHLHGFTREHLSRWRQVDAPPDPLEERRAEILLERRDLLGDGRLGDPEPLRGMAEVQRLGQGLERAQPVKIHSSDVLMERWPAAASRIGCPAPGGHRANASRVSARVRSYSSVSRMAKRPDRRQGHRGRAARRRRCGGYARREWVARGLCRRGRPSSPRRGTCAGA